MTLCALSKQPQIVFVLLELMVCQMTELRRRGAAQCPRLHFVATMGTSLAVSGDIAAWRLLEGKTY
jgi:hypothetical protein